MKASEADKFKAAPKLADLEVEEAGGHSHGAAGGHGHPMESVRTATHLGHEIVIKTCYEITVDGKPLATPLSVGNDGTLHTHALPEYGFSSAVDLVKTIVEIFPDEFPDVEPGHGHHDPESSSGQQGHGHGGHAHEHP
jgi:hypothetical protein